MTAYQPKTGARCGCKRGVERDNCAACEGTGMVIDFAEIRRRTAHHQKPKGENPNCDGSGGNGGKLHTVGEVRVLPTGGGGNAILCHACFEHERRWRTGRNRELARECQFRLPEWDDLEVYAP